ncbi:MAG: putative rane associated hydrolase, partial [Gemmatimonadetes bacterium]|nr:putative rane associated hydrolase [Gemmatimonadota bacterium]
DWITLVFDTFHDHVGRTTFSVNPSGVKQDAGIASAYDNPSWDAVWSVATAIDSLGWVAEFRIPLSQLRYSSAAEQTWGLQIWRTVSRLNETSMWSYWGVDEAGGPSRFGHVDGIRVTGRQRRAEVLPYMVAQLDALKPGVSSDPFYQQRSGELRAGGDVKYLLTNNLTLDATINPDFGQVEVDPAVVNLSAFETFFPERRPFFTEGSGTLGFGGFSCFFCSNVQSLSLFYSRRIGRAPQGPLPDGTEYADVPSATSILGAAKITGRTRGGWNIGVLDAMTASETARIESAGVPGQQEVEPFTNYFVGRLKRDLNNGNTVLGGIATSVWRNLSDPLLRTTLPVHAEAVGFDWNVRWKNRTYSFTGNVAGSNVAGDSAAMLRLQQSSARYFQRPDRDNAGNGLFSNAYDPSATRMGGYGLYSRVAKDAGNWLWEATVNLRSPGFETNDLAFLTRSDYVWMGANVMRQFSRPTTWYRSATLIAGAAQQLNYDGDRTDLDLHGFGRIEFRNYWELGGFVIRRPEALDDRALRGGPVVGRAASTYYSLFTNTDQRKAVSFQVQGSTSSNAEGARGYSVGTDLSFRPAANVQVSIGPEVSRYSSSQQYVTAVEDPTATAFYGRRYVMSDLRQDDFALNTRLNVTFTPTISLELFAQPLMSNVQYDRFKEFDAPRATGKSVYGVDRGTIAPITGEGGTVTGYLIDPDGTGGADQFTISNPDFSYRALRGNAVLRWEYLPGSTVFLVWTQDRDSFEQYTTTPGLAPNWQALRHAPANNVFLVKFNYWLSF